MEEKKTQPPTKVGKTWFMEKENGEVFAIDEAGAWDLLHQNANSMYRRRYKIVGVSDGQTYVQMIKNANNEKATIESQIAEKNRELTRYYETFDKFKFEELLEDTDPKVIRVKEITTRLQTELSELNSNFANINKVIVSKAFNAEFEKAKGNIEMPSNCDIITPNQADRNKILKSL
jgi:hypothetical protein